MGIETILQQRLGAHAVLTLPEDTRRFTEDFRMRYHGDAACVVLPANTAEISKIVKECKRHHVPVLPQGGNTSLVGGAVPNQTGPKPVIINLQRMRHIRSIDALNNTICVDAGCVLAHIHEAANAINRIYPVSLGAEGSCQIGGTISTNAGGTSVLRYGNTRDNILGLEVVLPNGDIWNGLNTLRKNNTGYDLKHLFIGAEGTLGIITGAVLKLSAQPRKQIIAWLGVDKLQDTLEILDLFRSKHETQLSAFELMNDAQVDLVSHMVTSQRCPIHEKCNWHILIELSDNHESDSLEYSMQNLLTEAFEKNLIKDASIATSEAQRKKIWGVRHSVTEANKKGGVGLTTDCAVPISAVPQFIESATNAVQKIVPDLSIIIVAHLGDGNVHLVPHFKFEQWDKCAEKALITSKIKHEIHEVAIAHGGTFSAEHGVGRMMLADMACYKSPIELNMMRAIKTTLDPENLFNPGHLLPHTT